MKKQKVIVDDLSWTAADVNAITEAPQKVEEVIGEYVQYCKILGGVDNTDKLTFKTVVATREEMSTKISTITSPLGIFEMLHKEKEVRDAANKATLAISRQLNELSYNEDMYKVFITYVQHAFPQEKKILTKEEILIVTDMRKSYKKMGMDLPLKDRKKLIAISNKMDKLAQDFENDCVKKNESGIWFTQSDLAGVPASHLETLQQKEGKYFVSVRMSDMDAVRKYAIKRSTREKIITLANQGAGDANTKRLQKTLALRSQASSMLGFSSFAELATDEQMVRGEPAVKKFLQGLIKGLQKGYNKELSSLQNVLPDNEKLDLVSVWYAEALLKKQKSGIDEEEFKQYFELENTLNALWGVWEKFFDLKVVFKKYVHDIDEEVRLYEVYDKKQKAVIASIVLDLFPRAGKYSHACVPTSFPRFIDMNGFLHTTTPFLICNFSKSQSIVLLSQNDIATLFHEGGHLLHAVLSNNKYRATSWGNLSIDFIEIASQVLEKFGTTPLGLVEIGKHYKTGKKIPNNLIANLEKSSRDTLFMWYRQFGFALFDITLHGSDLLTYTKSTTVIYDAFKKVTESVSGLLYTKPQKYISGFAHLMHGYESKYYSYVVSKVYADDVWQVLTEGGLNKQNKKFTDYRQMLEAGSKEKEMTLLKTFLGRLPAGKAFIKNMLS